MTDPTLINLDQLRADEQAAAADRDNAYEQLLPIELAHRDARRTLLIEVARALLDGADEESVFRAAGVEWLNPAACAEFSREIGNAVDESIVNRCPFMPKPLRKLVRVEVI